MAILKPFTFVAGQKAKADEVNQDFDVLYSEVNAIDTRIVDFSAEIETLQTTKANTNGNYANRFAVANPVNSYDAINKQYLEESQGPMRGYIDGLVITKGSNDKTILVSAGSCYDETLEHVIVLQDITEKENTTQSASTTYYVYIIAKTNGNEDILISTSSVNPPLPTDYVYYRKLGNYTTDSDNKIDTIDQSATKGITNNSQLFSALGMNTDGGYTVSSGWVATSSGWLSLECFSQEGGYSAWKINDKEVCRNDQTNGGGRAGSLTIRAIAYISKGQTLTKTGALYATATFYPAKG